MARKRREIGESIETLLRLEKRHHGKPEAARVKLLRLLKENPDLSIDEAAARVDYAVQTVKRWLQVYHESGIDAMLGGGRGRKPVPSLDRKFISLKRKIASGDLASVEDVAHWIDSLSSSSHGRNGEGSATRAEYGIPEFIVRALASLPVSPDPSVWTVGLKEALGKLLVGVDRVLFSVNLTCDITDPQDYDASGRVVVSQSIRTGHREISTVPDDTGGDDSMHLARFIDNIKKENFPLERYHEPLCFVYYASPNAFLGILLLLGERHRNPISQRMVRTVERLRPFIVYLLSDVVARYRHANPEHFVLDAAFGEIIKGLGLTDQERRIVVLQILGYTYADAASTLNMSVNTLRHHVKNIHHKAGVRSQGELLAKYFSPRLGPDTAGRS